MPYIVVDIEADGPCPGEYSMVSFGAVLVAPGLEKTFYGQVKPISEKWIPDALKVSGHSREETLTFQDPKIVMEQFAKWIAEVSPKRAIFISDNNGFDWQFINYYFHRFYGSNPFGFSSQNLGSFYKGLTKDMFGSFKHLRETKHSHHPVDDAKGNAEAIIKLVRKYELKGIL